LEREISWQFFQVFQGKFLQKINSAVLQFGKGTDGRADTVISIGASKERNRAEM
jgi:hypothetical protein